jgi:hypothetical protein
MVGGMGGRTDLKVGHYKIKGRTLRVAGRGLFFWNTGPSYVRAG